MADTTEARDRAGVDHGAAYRIGDAQLAAAGRRKEDVGGAAGEHVDEAVADLNGAAADHAAV